MRQNKFWLKLAGVAILIHVVLITISILEVVVYSYLVEPGYEEAYYSQHATRSGPWVSAIFGSLLMFFLVRRYIRRFSDRQLTYAIMLPVIYIITDQILFIIAKADIMGNITEIVAANGVKVLAALGAYFLYKPKRNQESFSG